MRLRPCPACGRPYGGTCRCGYRRDRTDLSTPTEIQRRAAAVQAHVAKHGYLCPGWPEERWHRADPATNPLTADHADPVAAGGRRSGPLRVLCRRHNSARANHHRQEH